MSKKLCEVCEKEIDQKKDRYVSLITNQGEKVIEEAYFHITCFQDWFNSKVIAKVVQGQKKAMNLMGNLFNKIHDIPNES